MKARLVVLLVALAALAFGAWKVVEWRNQPPEVTFARAVRENISSSVSTNGKAEPVEWAAARAERSGAVSRIAVRLGEVVAAGQVLVELEAAEARADLISAESRISAAKAEMETLGQGGRAAELADIASSIDRTRLELSNAQREYDTLVRLQARQAATKTEVDAAKQLVDQAQLQIQALQRKRGALVAAADKTSAAARLRDAESAAELAQGRIRQSAVRAPTAGTIYQFDIKPGAYLNTGDIVATIGRLERIHVNVYVDEPDLGRVAKGMPVIITWDALPGRRWTGSVERTATQIVTLGARQVGEVVCTVANPDRDLIPGTNVSAEILSESVANAVTVPKETLRRENGKDGVYILEGDHIRWRPVTLGVTNTTRAEVKELREGDALVLPTELALKDGLVVRPIVR